MVVDCSCDAQISSDVGISLSFIQLGFSIFQPTGLAGRQYWNPKPTAPSAHAALYLSFPLWFGESKELLQLSADDPPGSCLVMVGILRSHITVTVMDMGVEGSW